MNCGLCFNSLRRTKAFDVYEIYFDNNNRLVDVIEKYLQIKVKITDSQSCSICKTCYTHLDDFHKFALLVKERQESLLNEIPTIKLDDSDEDGDQETSYIRDTDVLVEFKGADADSIVENEDINFNQEDDDLLMVSETINDFHNNSNFNSDSMSMSSFEHMHWLRKYNPGPKSKSQTKIQRKTPYKTHTPEDRARIVDAANRGDDWSALATKLGVKYKTAYTWVSTSRKEMFLNNGKNNTTFTEKEIETIIKWTEDNRQITLKEIVARVKVIMRKEVCVYFIEGSLEGRLYRHKRSIDYNPLLINTIENKTKRLEYVNTLNYYMNAKKTIVWFGETNFKMFCRRAKGRFNTNSTFATFDPTIFIMGAVSKEGVINLQRSRERINPGDIFKDWSQAEAENLSNLVIVCDSDYCFSELDEYFNSSDVTLLLLSPYSYMLNPMETIWNNIIFKVKSDPNLSTFNFNDIKEQRLVIAETNIDQVIATISIEDCYKAIKKSNKYHNDILEMQDMPVK